MTSGVATGLAGATGRSLVAPLACMIATTFSTGERYFDRTVASAVNSSLRTISSTSGMIW